MEEVKKKTNDVFEEETYKKIISALSHPVRRRLLRLLADAPRKFSDLHEALKITSSHLSYHINQLGELLGSENGAYKLSTFGEAAIELIQGVEGYSEKKWSNKAFQFEQSRAKFILQEYENGLINNRTWTVGLTLILSWCFSFLIFQATSALPPDNLIIENFRMSIYAIPLVLFLKRDLLFNRLPPIKPREQLLIRGLALIHMGLLLFGWLIQFSNIQSILYSSFFSTWWLIRGIYYAYTNTIYPIILFVVVWLVLRFWFKDNYKQNFISRFSGELGLNAQNIQKYITKNG